MAFRKCHADLFLILVFYTNSVVPAASQCPNVCSCNDFKDGNNVVAGADVLCDTGGLNDDHIMQIVADIPEHVRRIRIIGPPDNPNKFSISEDFGRFYDLQELHLINNGIRSLGQSVFIYSKNLKVLNVAGNAITQLRPETFEGMDNLQTLDVSSNRLSEDHLITGLFSNLRDLRLLNLGNNNIRYFPADVFAGLKRLTDLVLSGNYPNISDVYLLVQLQQLESLQLANCELTQLPAQTLARNRRLKRMNLSGNNLKTLDALMHNSILQLEHLDLSRNGINSISDYSLSVFPYLRTLNLAGNSLGIGSSDNDVGFTAKAFARTNLTWLDLGENQFQHFNADSLGDSRQTIQHLRLAGNNLRKLSSNLMRNMTELVSLDVSAIGLTQIPPWLPSELLQLHRLNLSYNPLDQNVFNLVQQLVQLRVLDVSYCNLTDALPSHFIAFASKTLDELYLHDNPWHCDCQLTDQLRQFLVSHKTVASACRLLRYDRIRCATPVSLNNTPIAIVRPPGCDEINSSDLKLAATGLTAYSEIGILIAAVCVAIFIVVALIVGIACSHLRPRASYRTNEDKVNLSNGDESTNNENQAIMVSTITPSSGGIERLF